MTKGRSKQRRERKDFRPDRAAASQEEHEPQESANRWKAMRNVVKAAIQPRRKACKEHDETTRSAERRASSRQPLPTYQTQRGRKGGWNPEEVKLHPRHESGAGIACQSLLPRHAPMGPLLSRERAICGGGGQRRHRSQGDRDGLGAQQTHPFASRLAPAPVSPEDRLRRWEWRWLSG